MKPTTITLLFHDHAGAVAWFEEAREFGHIPRTSGLRQADMLDHIERGNRLIVSAEDAPGAWAVEPVEEASGDD